MSILAIVMLITLTLTITYAFFRAQDVGLFSDDVLVSSNTTDSLIFNITDDINIYVNQNNFAENAGNLSASTVATASLLANNNTNNATEKYNLFFVIDVNELEYTTVDKRPELVFTVTDPNGNYVQTIKGLNGSNGVFDITDRTGAFKIASNYEIQSSNGVMTTQDWTITVTFINLDTDQSINGGRYVSGKILITKENMPSYELPLINSIITSDYSNIDETSVSYITNNSINMNLNIAKGSDSVNKYYYAIVPNGNSITQSDYIENNESNYIFNNLNSNTDYKVSAYVKDKNGYMSNVYETVLTTTNYLLPQVTGMDLNVVDDSIHVDITSSNGTNNITGYMYNCGSEWSEITSNKSYICNNVTSGNTYIIKAKAIDSNNKSSVEYVDKITIDELYNNSKNRTRELMSLYNTLAISSPVSTKIPEYDFVQPWLFNEMSKQDIESYFKRLKRAQYKGIVLQYTMELNVENNSSVVTSAWYNSSLINNSNSLVVYRPNILGNILQVAEDLGMEVYIGLGNYTDYWEDGILTNSSWINSAKNTYNAMISEILTNFGSYDSFVGWYWPIEIYASSMANMNTWSSFLNSNIAALTDNRPLLISPFVSALYDLSDSEITSEWESFISNTNFRSGDIIGLQDCLGTSILKPKVVLKYIEALADVISNSNKNIDFWLNVENYEGSNSASIERYYQQLKIASVYADNLSSFSYSHYYLSNSYDKEFRTFAKITDSIIDVPLNGSVYEDINGEEVPVPTGFSVSSTDNIVKDGLVIKDSSNNEFVWIPVNGGVKPNCYTYLDDEYKTVYYTRYLNNNILCNDGSNDTLPVSSDTSQIIKYGGFYVGRYETSFDYNGGSFIPMVKASNNASSSFTYSYADSSYYTGYLWNNINYENAKLVSENMDSNYNYDSSVKTGLINGTEWDTMLRWIHVNDSTYNVLYDSRGIGNYIDSNGNAATGNYESGVLKPSGSNANWSYMKIYDIAGNLREWTSEKTGPSGSEQHVLRTADYNTTGISGSLSYGESSASYAFPNVGFRIVLYIE